MKRIFDLAMSLAGLVLTAPLWLVIALAIKTTSRGPVFYRATRAGRGGRRFTMHKFRTMTDVPDEERPRITVGGDVRVTSVGRWLRAAKLDELPQLYDVLVGNMSLVGPRPEDPHYVGGYDERQRQVLSVRPGITGPTAIAFRHEEKMLSSASDPERVYVEEILPAKLEMDLAYVHTRSFSGDVAVLMQTLISIFKRDAEAAAPEG